MTELTLEIITPERIVFSGLVDQVTIPGSEGQFSVLKGHAPLLSAVDIGELYYKRGQNLIRYAINTGFAQVSHNRVTILVETAERADTIDRERALRAKQRAAERMGIVSREDVEFQKLQVALQRAIIRLKIAEDG